MAKLVVLSEGYAGLTYELKAERTTVGRVEDNAFQIPDASVSSHHCEIIQQGEGWLVRDLGSTNGSFIEGEQITEATLKKGQILRVGHIDVRLEVPGVNPAKAKVDQTQVIQQGVRAENLHRKVQGSGNTSQVFKPKKNNAGKFFLIFGIVLGVVIVGLLVMVLVKLK